MEIADSTYADPSLNFDFRYGEDFGVSDEAKFWLSMIVRIRVLLE